MSDRTFQFPGRSGGQGGSAPDDPGLTVRVARLEEANIRIEASLARIGTAQQRFAEAQQQFGEAQHRTEIELAEMKGRFRGPEKAFSLLPTSLQLIGFTVVVFIAAGLLRLFEPRLFPYPPPPPAISGTR